VPDTLQQYPRRAALLIGSAGVIYLVLFWRLGFSSFWDPDEAVYAVATREMLRTGDWLAPMYNGQPFFDKPIFFYWLQLLSFKIFGATELAARLVPAISALAMIFVTGWAGRVFFNSTVGVIAALFVALLPGTFALSAYAILDMTFTAFLFAGVTMAAASALRGRPALQYGGYLCIALAVLTKGPLAIVLAGLAFGLALLVAPRIRAQLLALHWVRGLALVLVIASPWFIYMYARFGQPFIQGYFLQENILLFADPPYGPTTKSNWFYVRLAVVGLLPWTPVLIGRVIDALRGDRLSDEDRLLWSWSAAVIVFFSFSRFKLDHYVYPALPALSLIAAHAWWRVSTATIRRPHLGAACGVACVGILLLAGGLAAAGQSLQITPDVSRAVLLVPVALIAAGILFLVVFVRRGFRPLALPFFPSAALLVLYGVVLIIGLEAMERAKPMKSLATWVAENAPADATISAYRLDRWKTSLRFYVDRHTEVAESPADVLKTLKRPGPHYLVMRLADFDELKSADPDRSLRVVKEQQGLNSTSGRGLLRAKRNEWPRFVVVTAAAAAEASTSPQSQVDGPTTVPTPARPWRVMRPAREPAVPQRSRSGR
jgi:4-amino-4-deoxy-L-arabinose transferase-like glycosyltransferase